MSFLRHGAAAAGVPAPTSFCPELTPPVPFSPSPSLIIIARPAAFPFFYIEPSAKANAEIIAKYNKKNVPISKFAPIGEARRRIHSLRHRHSSRSSLLLSFSPFVYSLGNPFGFCPFPAQATPP